MSEKFRKQKAAWIPSYTMQQMREIYAYDPDDTSVGVEDFEEAGFFYDSDKKLFYMNEEHYLKANEEV